MHIHTLFTILLVQGDQLNMAVFCPVYMYTAAYTGKVILYKVPENTVIFNWSPCMHYFFLHSFGNPS